MCRRRPWSVTPSDWNAACVRVTRIRRDQQRPIEERLLGLGLADTVLVVGFASIPVVPIEPREAHPIEQRYVLTLISHRSSGRSRCRPDRCLLPFALALQISSAVEERGRRLLETPRLTTIDGSSLASMPASALRAGEIAIWIAACWRRGG
jgi:hypothetical protein